MSAEAQSGLPDDPDFLSTLSAVAYDEERGTLILCSQNVISFYNTQSGDQSDWVTTPLQSVSGAINYDSTQLLFFDGDTYVTYDKTSQQFSTPARWPGLPTHWQGRIQAVADWGNNQLLFSNGNEYSIIDLNTQQFTPAQNLGQLRGWQSTWTNEPSSIWRNGSVAYFLLGDRIVTFDLSQQQFIGTTSIPKRQVTTTIPKRTQQATTSFTETASTGNTHPFLNHGNSEEYVIEEVSIGWDNYDPQRDGRYRTDYPDYEKGNFTQDKAFTENVKVRGYDWLGAGINITKYNPIFPTDSWAANDSPIITTLSPKTGGNRGTDVLPWGTKSRTISSVRGQEKKQWVTSFDDFLKVFKLSGGVNGGINGKSGKQIAGADFSGSFKELTQDNIGSEFIYHFQKTNRTSYTLSMDLFWRDAQNGMCRQKTSTAFEDAIIALPNTPSTEQCFQVIETFGTHIVSGMVMGGIHLTLTEIEKSNFMSKRLTESVFKAKIEGDIKKVSLGANVEISDRTEATSKGSTETLDQQIIAVGGYAHQNKEKWADALKDDPVAIEMTMVPLSQVMTPIFFPNDKGITSKKTAMFTAIREYIKLNTPPPVETDNTFFDVEKYLADGWETDVKAKAPSGKIILKNESHYDIKATITYALNGRDHVRNIAPAMHKQNGQRVIPSGASNIRIKVEWKELFEWKKLGERSYPENGEYTLTSKGAFLQAPTLIGD